MRTVRSPWLVTAALLCLAVSLPAQNGAGQQGESDQSWNSTTSLQDQAGTTNPTRVLQSHREQDGKTVDVQTLQTPDINGGSQVYGQTETETVKVDAGTTRVVTRHYVTDNDGRRVLNSTTVEEKRELPDGSENIVRTVSNPDSNGQLQVTRREVQRSTQDTPDVRTTNTTVLLPGPDGRLAPSTETHEVQKQLQPGLTEYTKSVALPDGNGNWQVNELRQGTIEKSGDTEIKQESVSRLNADGKITPVERTVSKTTDQAGEQRKEVQTYSTSMGGVTAYPDGQMHLDRQVTTLTRTGPGGEQSRQEQVSERSQASPDAGLRPAQRVLDITRSGLEGVQQQTVTIESATPDGGMGVVWVDTGKATGSRPVTVDTKNSPPEKSATPSPR